VINLKLTRMLHKIALIYTWLVRTLLIWLPDQPAIMRFRGWLYGFMMAGCGTNFQVSASVVLRCLENISVGRDVYLAPGVVLNASGPINLHDEVMVGFNSLLVSGNHSARNRSFRFGAPVLGEIKIGYGSWIAGNCTVLAGANMGTCCVLAANSVCSKKVADFLIFGGVPAKLIGSVEMR